MLPDSNLHPAPGNFDQVANRESQRRLQQIAAGVLGITLASAALSLVTPQFSASGYGRDTSGRPLPNGAAYAALRTITVDSDAAVMPVSLVGEPVEVMNVAAATSAPASSAPAALTSAAPDEKAPHEDTDVLNLPDSMPIVKVNAVRVPTGELLSRPVSGPLTSRFGMRFHPVLRVTKLHTGADFANSCGTPVAAARGGVVTYAGVAGGYGGRVVVDHGRVAGMRVQTSYSHLSAIGVHVGQQVQVHDGIGLVGSTGYSTGCHLHFEVMVNGQFTDPLPWLNGQAAVVDLSNMQMSIVSTASTTPTPSLPPTPSPKPSASAAASASAAPRPPKPAAAATRRAPAPAPAPAPKASASSSQITMDTDDWWLSPDLPAETNKTTPSAPAPVPAPAPTADAAPDAFDPVSQP